ncbi:MAG: radical SAM protein [Melioribacteraceae bacterium]|nr:radical SAM protein [Melioribacteraceae bacterium]
MIQVPQFSAQVNLTTRCNCNCYFCLIEELKRKGIETPKRDLPLQAIHSLIEQHVEHIHFCGDRGEALFHPELDRIIDLIKSYGIQISMSTNGSVKSTDWWYEFGKKCTKEDKVVFALDGLEESHKVYRGTDWKTITDNARAFMKGGGTAVWKMIVFQHNEKDIPFVKGISKAMGFKSTWLINSRGYNNRYKKPETRLGKTRVEVFEEYGCAEVRCRFPRNEQFYVAIDGTVWPCCIIRTIYLCGEAPNIQEAIDKDGDYIHILKTPLRYIINNSHLFNTVFENFPHWDYCQIYCNADRTVIRQVIPNDPERSL